MLSRTSAHGCALDVQICAAGLSQLVSASVPARALSVGAPPPLCIDPRIARSADERDTLRSARDESFFPHRIARYQFESAGGNHDRHAERAAGSLLAQMAVANVSGERRLRYEVADFAAVTAARYRKLGSHPPSIAGQRRATSPPPLTPALCFRRAVALVELHHAAEQFRHVAMRSGSSHAPNESSAMSCAASHEFIPAAWRLRASRST